MPSTQSPTVRTSATATMFAILEPTIQYEANTGCWLSAMSGPAGYAQVRRGEERMLGHRASWEHHNGPIPDGMWVLHRCDTPACCNPDHLFLGRPADNSADMVRKGRHKHPKPQLGTANAQARLTPEAVRDIRRLYRPSAPGNRPNPCSAVGLGRTFGVGPEAIMRVLTGKTWGHVK